MSNFMIMNCIPFTRGHEHLVRFAANYSASMGEPLVIYLPTSPNDPVNFENKVQSIQYAVAALEGSQVEFVEIHNEDFLVKGTVPADEFWKPWTDLIENTTRDLIADGVLHDDDKVKAIITSEEWGYEFAERLGIEHIPCDIDRVFCKVKATPIRQNLWDNFDKLSYPSQVLHRINAVIFGAESCGKTTFSRKLAEHLDIPVLDEWARPYLERLTDKTITAEKLEKIMAAQSSAEAVATINTGNNPANIFDTDVMSTYGYYKITGIKIPKSVEHALDEVRLASAAGRQTRKIYFVMKQDNVPFTPDPLRYGIDKRESTDQFWIDILEEFGFEYHVIDAMDPESINIAASIIKEKVNGAMQRYERYHVE